jgi:hypothetical protein
VPTSALLRTVALVPGEITAKRMLAELDLPAFVERREDLLNAVGDSLEPLYGVIVNARAGPTTGRGEQVFGIFYLLTRGLSDVLAGAHLVSHCYLSQAYSVMRPVLDGCDLVELFAQDPARAALWANTTQGHKDFAPADVRELIGVDRHDPVDSHFSECGSHPRFAGARLSGGMRIGRENPDDKTAILRIGPMWPEHPSTLFAWAFTFETVVKLGREFRHLVDVTDEATTHGGWMKAYLGSVDACVRGMELVLTELGEDVDDDDDPIAEYRALRSQLTALIEEEAAAG